MISQPLFDMAQKITYESTGVQYDVLDGFKVLAQKAAASTDGNADHLDIKTLPECRGESVFLFETATNYIAHIEETLGTKNLVADLMYPITGKSYYDAIAIDTVAAIINDIMSLGALPVTIAMHLAAGKSEWFTDDQRVSDLVEGWKQACDESMVVWGGGETPTLKGVVEADTVLLSGSSVGIIEDKANRIKGDLQAGDAIMFVASNGIHANGLTLSRKIAEGFDEGFGVKMDNGRMFGEAILDSSRIYVKLLKGLQEAKVGIHYTSHITGHGFRKIMRGQAELTYRIQKLQKPQAVFGFIQQHSGLDDREMYETFNMGTGYAFFIPVEGVDSFLEVAKSTGYDAIHAGVVEAGPRSVVIEPIDVTFGGEELKVR